VEARTIRADVFRPAPEFEPFDLFAPAKPIRWRTRPSWLRAVAAIAVVFLSAVLAMVVAARALGLA
jgi:hypothetical protein